MIQMRHCKSTFSISKSASGETLVKKEAASKRYRLQNFSRERDHDQLIALLALPADQGCSPGGSGGRCPL